MSTIEAFLLDLSHHDIQIWADGDRFRVRAAKGVLTPDIQNQLKRRKPEILAFLQARQTRGGKIRPVPREGRIPLSAAQLRLWFLDRLEGASPVYNMPSIWRLQGPLMVTVLEQSLADLVSRHESLRTTFHERDGQPEQRIHAPREVVVRVQDEQGLDGAARERETRRLLKAAAHRPFDLETGPLLRLEVVRLGEGDHLLVFNLHHIISDGWSLEIMIRDWAAAYARFAANRRDSLAEAAIQYADYAVWQQAGQKAGVWQDQLAFWQRALAGIPSELTLATDRPRPRVKTYRGRRWFFSLDPAACRELIHLSGGAGTTLFMALEAVFAVLLSRYSGQDEIAVGTVVANRGRREIQNSLGFFANTLVLRNDLSGNPHFGSLLGRVKQTVRAALANQEIPFERVVDACQPERSLGRSPLFQVMFVLQNELREKPGVAGLRFTPLEPEVRTSKFDLTLGIDESSTGLSAFMEYSSELFDAVTIARMGRNLQTLIRAIVVSPHVPVSRLPLLAPAESAWLLYGWNDTDTTYPDELTAPAKVAARAHLTPDAAATSYEGIRGMAGCLSFGKLNRQADRLAHRLRDLGIGPGKVVGIFSDRRPEMVVGMLAVWKAGGAYLPLDDASPRERIRFMLADAGATVVLTLNRYRATFEKKVSILCLDTRRAFSGVGTRPRKVRPEYPSYLIYTSGSTGRPKGVEISQQSLTNMMNWNRAAFALTGDDRTTQLANPAFDASVWELWPALTAGSQVHLLAPEILEEGETLRDWLISRKITVCFVPTPLAEVLMSQVWPRRVALRCLQTAGDRLHQWPDQNLPFKLVNNYGPTENTVVATFATVEPARGERPAQWPPIGRPVANIRCLVLDARLQLAPLGAAGELCLGGRGLARGYRHRAALTAERFVPHPFFGQAGARLYRSGDRVRLGHHGLLAFLGRLDGQIKLRSFRVELGEIETVLAQHPQVSAAAVILQERARGLRQLMAFLTWRGVQTDGDVALRGYLRERLPVHMIPTRFVFLPRLPLTPNGKVDRVGLDRVAPDRVALDRVTPDRVTSDRIAPHRGAPEEGDRPQTHAERVLAGIWRELLDLERVGVHDNFFELGGDSILSIQVVSRARKAGLSLVPKQIFEFQTIAGLAEVAGSAAYRTTLGESAAVECSPAGLSRGDRAGLERLLSDHPDVVDHYPLTPMQEGMLFHGLFDGVSHDYFEQLSCRLTGKLDIDAFRQAWLDVMDRHAVLRTSFHWQGLDRPRQWVHRAAAPAWQFHDGRGLAAAERGTKLAQYRAEDRARGFAFEQAPLMRMALFEWGLGQYDFVWSYHHLLLDGWSLPNLMRDLLGYYEALCAGRNYRPEPVRPFRDYIVWLRRQDTTEARSFWVRTLQGFTGPTPLPDFGRMEQAKEPLVHDNAFLALSEEVARVLRDMARCRRLTLNTLIQGAWALLLGGYAGQTDIVFGATVSGRPAELDGIESMVGLFINTVPVRVRLDDGHRLAPWLEGLQAEAAVRSRFEFCSLSEIQSWQGDSRQTLFESIVIFENYPVDASLREWRGSLVFDEVKTFEQTHYPLNLVVRPNPELVLQLNYDTSRFDRAGAVRILEDLQTLMEKMAVDPEVRLGSLPIPVLARSSSGPAPLNRREPRAAKAGRPRTDAERELTRIWEDVLHLERVGIHDNYFELGGDSILSIQIVSRARAAGLRLTPKQIFEGQTIAAVAKVAPADQIIRAEQELVVGAVPLTPIQWWFFETDPLDPHHFNQAVLLETDPALDPAWVAAAVHGLARHHDALRLRFRHEPEGWVQAHAEAELEPSFEVLTIDSATRFSEYLSLVAEVRQASLDLAMGPLWRVVMFHRPGQRGRLFLVIHHLVTDGVSWRILLEDLDRACDLVRRREPLRFPPKTTSFKAWAESQAEPLPPEEKAHWTRLAEVSTTPLPCDREAGAELNTHGSASEVFVSLSRARTRDLLEKAGRAYRTHINDLLLAALVQTLTHFYRLPYLWVNLEDHGRENSTEGMDLSRTLGWFTSLFPVLLHPGKDPGAVIKAVKEKLRAVPKRGTGYGRLRYLGDKATRMKMKALPQPDILFNYLGRLDRVLDETGFFTPASEPTGRFASPRANRAHLLEINGHVQNGRLHLAWTFSRCFHDEATIQALADAYLQNLESLIAHCLMPEAGGFTPSDFPLAGLNGTSLDSLIAKYPGIEDLYPLSPMQEGMLFHDLYARGTGVYFVQVVAELRGPLDADAFQSAWAEVLARHTLLRTGFVWEDLVRPLQMVHGEVSPEWERQDWSAIEADGQIKRLQRARHADRDRGFHLDRPPLMRFALFKMAPDRRWFMWSHHHLLLDGWSLPHLLNEVFRFYQAFREGKKLRLPRATPFRAYIAWLHEQDRQEAKLFWQKALAGVRSPTPLPGARRSGSAGPTHESEVLELSEELTQSLRGLAREQRLTLSILVQGAWALLLSRYSHEPSVVFGVTVSGRPPELPGVESLMGLLINTLPVRAPVPGSARLCSWLEAMQERQTAMARFTYSALADIQGWSEVPRGTPLFESIVVFENYPVERSLPTEVGGLRIENPRVFERTNFPLTLIAQPGPSLNLCLNYDPQRFEPGALSRLTKHLSNLLRAFVGAPSQRLSGISMMDEAERAQLLAAWQRNRIEVPHEHPLHRRFEVTAARGPDAVALVDRHTRLSYGQLNAMANRLARELRARGLGRERLAGLCMDRSLEMVIGILAILKAGGAYLPLDPVNPPERLFTILDDARPTVVISGSKQAGLFEKRSEPRLALDRDAAALDPGDAPNPAPATHPENLAYIIYTSGSTGRPKGVAVTHANVTRLLDGAQDRYGFHRRDVWSLFHSYAFDVSVWEIWGAFLHGGCLLVVSFWQSRSPDAMVALVYRERVTVLNQTPSAFGQFMRAEAEDPHPEHLKLRWIIFAGEALDPPRLKPWFARHGDQKPRLANMYGITETTVHVTYYHVTQADTAAKHGLVGQPLADWTINFLDDDLHPVPAEVPGEMYVGGAGVARGYLARPGLTAQRFVPDPCAPEPGRRLYKSGDQARYLPRGRSSLGQPGPTIEYLGRLDHQIKIRGFRIELGEIETVLASHPRVVEAAVLFREDEPGHPRLVGYAQLEPTAAREDAAHTSVAIRTFLAKKLPDYMVPAMIMVLETIPLNPNGKVDRRALPAPDPHLATDHVAPGNPLEAMLAEIWADLLKLERVGIYDHFFEAGGHSLVATRVISRIRRDLGVEISIRRLFAEPTIAQLAATIADRQRNSGQSVLLPIEPVPRERDGHGVASLPLSFAQSRLWFLDQLEGPNATYNMPCALRLQGRLDCPSLERGIAEVVRRHEILRTRFPSVDGEPVQAIVPFEAFTLSVEAFVPLGDPETALPARIAAEARAPFDLARGPLFRSRLLRLSPSDHVLLLTMHHIIADGWSAGILVAELTALYRGFTTGAAADSALPELPVQYADFAAWQRGRLHAGTHENQLAFWREHLAGMPALLDLPTDRARPNRQRFHGRRLSFTIDAAIASSLESLARDMGATLFMVLHAAWAVLLSRYSGQDDLTVGSPIANRTRGETEGLIGFFANTLVFRHDCSGDPSFAAMLARVRRTALNVFENQDVPFEGVVEALQPERDLGASPLFQVMLVLQNAPLVAAVIEPLRISPLEIENGTAKFDILLEVAQRAGVLAVSWEYNADLFDASTACRMVSHFQNLLRPLAERTGERISRLPLLSHAERFQLTRVWNRPEAPPRGEDFLARFEAWAARTPDATVLVHHGQRLSYAALQGGAQRLAVYLRDLGFGPDQVAAIALERSCAMATTMLAVLQTGGAYLPLDPAYPRERLDFMLTDSGASFLLTRTGVLPELTETKAVCIDVDSVSCSSWPGRSWPGFKHMASRSMVRADTDRLAYLLYTSGSTGRPKGVAMRRGALADMVSWQVNLSKGCPKTLQFAALGFDIHFQEFFASWGAGSCLVLIDERQRRDPAAAWRVVVDEQIERVFLPFVALQQWAEAVASTPTERLPIREIYTAGEALRMTRPIVALLAGLEGCVLGNHYGPTEGHVVTAYTVPAGEALPAVGRPVAGASVYLLDRFLQPVPIGVHGELFIGGRALARGYSGRPGMTAEKFIPDVGGETPGGRLYRSGDLARFRPDGVIDFLGRADDQVKLRGFRVELGEIETVLGRHPAVRKNAVLVREDRPGEPLLTAYVCLVQHADLDPDPRNALRTYLEGKLPDYMMPSTWVFLDGLPLTPSGKVDRRALPNPEVTASSVSEPPRDPVEATLAAIWAGVLRTPVGVHDHFFRVGGHSLLATRVITRIREAFAIELPLHALFEAPTVAELAQRVTAARRDDPLPLLPRPSPRDTARFDGSSGYPLSLAQQRLWFLSQMRGTERVYNLPFAFRLSGALDVPALRGAVVALAARHESLRTTIRLVGDEPRQFVAQDPCVDLAVVSVGDEAEAMQRVRRAFARSFDFEKAPPWRLELVHIAENDHLLVLNMHHIIADGWSLEVMVRDLAALYQAGRAAIADAGALPPLPIQYADYAIWQREGFTPAMLARQLAYWKQKLASAPRLITLPHDRPRPPHLTFDGATVPIDLGRGLTRKLEGLSRVLGTTMHMTLLACFAVQLARYSGQDDLVIGSAVANRRYREIEGLIGFFVNTLALRVDLAAAAGFHELASRVRATALEAYHHQDVPFEQVVEALQPERNLSHAPVFQVSFSLQNAPMERLRLPDLAMTPLEIGAEAVKFDLTLSLAETDQGVMGVFQYNKRLFDDTAVARMPGHFRVLAEAIASNPKISPERLPLLTAAEAYLLVRAWNETAVPYEEKRVHHWIEDHAARRADAIAVSFQGRDLSYSFLNGQANQLARQLRDLGVGWDVPVGIFIERSLEMILGKLAVLKAGGAYLPIDPGFPRDRIAFMLADAGISVLLAHTADTGQLPESTAQVLAMDDPPAWLAGSPRNLGNAVGGDHLAYLIYTSGSTGLPKGVANVHRGLTNLVSYYRDVAAVSEEDRAIQAARSSFDVSVWEIWSYLSAGARLCLVPPSLTLTPETYRAWLLRQRITIGFAPPVVMEAFMSMEWPQRVPLRQLLSGGDRLNRYPPPGFPFRIVNSYGPSEDSVMTTYAALRPEPNATAPPPIGRTIANQLNYILDRHLAPVPIRVPGELHIGGIGLARGYAARAVLTAEKFIPSPFGVVPGARLYRTGDLVRHRCDGHIEFLDRIDQQVKLRGFRIELGEIEAVLSTCADVVETVVVKREEQPGHPYLAAYVAGPTWSVAEENDAAGDLGARIAGLRQFLKDKLPDFMVPAFFVPLSHLPLTANGKIDRKALPAPGIVVRETEHVAPRNHVESQLATIWERALRAEQGGNAIERIGVHDNFFDIGGHSLLATRVMATIRQTFGVELPLENLFEEPTIARLAELVDVFGEPGAGAGETEDLEEGEI